MCSPVAVDSQHACRHRHGKLRGSGSVGDNRGDGGCVHFKPGRRARACAHSVYKRARAAHGRRYDDNLFAERTRRFRGAPEGMSVQLISFSRSGLISERTNCALACHTTQRRRRRRRARARARATHILASQIMCAGICEVLCNVYEHIHSVFQPID